MGIVLIEFLILRRIAFKYALATFIAFVVGALLFILVRGIACNFFPAFAESLWAQAMALIVVEYVCIATAYALLPNINALIVNVSSKENAKGYKILDTSVIVDGRILDIAETGFLDGVFIVPQFVITEIQHLSDSHDGQKRIRGRRALDLLNSMKNSKHMPISIVQHDFPEIKEVDRKLVELGKQMKAKVITNDYNLNKVAAINDVEVLNINDLIGALRPVALPNETISITLVREGQEKNQSVGYLEDGTMVIVENSRQMIGKEVSAKITHLHQTPTGRIIFSEMVPGSARKAREIERPQDRKADVTKYTPFRKEQKNGAAGEKKKNMNKRPKKKTPQKPSEQPPQ